MSTIQEEISLISSATTNITTSLSKPMPIHTSTSTSTTSSTILSSSLQATDASTLPPTRRRRRRDSDIDSEDPYVEEIAIKLHNSMCISSVDDTEAKINHSFTSSPQGDIPTKVSHAIICPNPPHKRLHTIESPKASSLSASFGKPKYEAKSFIHPRTDNHLFENFEEDKSQDYKESAEQLGATELSNDKKNLSKHEDTQNSLSSQIESHKRTRIPTPVTSDRQRKLCKGNVSEMSELELYDDDDGSDELNCMLNGFTFTRRRDFMPYIT